MVEYQEFIKTKIKNIEKTGFEVNDLNVNLFPFQSWIVKRSLRFGRYAIFADCGLGKTIMQLEWCHQVVKNTGGEVLLLAPLAVTDQTIEEAERFNISLDGITITNYEQVDNLDVNKYVGICLDESSILKNYNGAIKNKIVLGFEKTKYKLACSATPSPNDPIELGSHSEFLNQMSGSEMLAMFFINDGMKGEKWKLKGHAEKAFYRWVSTWAVMLNKPSHIGFSDDGYNLPELEIIEHRIETPKRDNGEFFNDYAVSAITFNHELMRTQRQRIDVAKSLIQDNENHILVCKQNEEAGILEKEIPGSVNVSGSDYPDIKKRNLLDFAKDKYRVLISKSKIMQFGLNYQNCHSVIIVSPDFSFEALYQVIRRTWRFGQKSKVTVHVIVTDTMGNVKKSIDEKTTKFRKMQEYMIEAMKENLEGVEMFDFNFSTEKEENEYYSIYQGDSFELVKSVPDESIGLSIFSPPFSSLYVYSDNARDLSNCIDNDEFFKHFDFLIDDLLRVTKPGRLCAIHLTQLTTLMGKDGFYSIIDFRGDVIRLFQKHGWIHHAEVTIWKDPQLAAVRTKCIQLLHSQTKRDSCVSRPGLADYLVVFRKPGGNAEPVNYEGNGLPFEVWTEYASPVWMDINPSDTLQFRGGRDDDDVKHITPTQLEVWKRAIALWSNPGDTVFTPFMGIGSEVYQSVIMNRRAIGFELKESYFDQAKKNMIEAIKLKSQGELF